jgi:hypothetical protein
MLMVKSAGRGAFRCLCRTTGGKDSNWQERNGPQTDPQGSGELMMEVTQSTKDKIQPEQ